MNMKKTFAGCLILIAVLTLAVVSAGCVNQPSGDEQGIDVPDASHIVRIIEVEKTGTTYSIGDTVEVNFINFPEQAELYVKEQGDGISIEKKKSSVKLGEKDVICTSFTVTALKNGNQAFKFGIENPLREEYNLDDVLYEDIMRVADTGSEPMTPRGVFTVINSDTRPTYPGEYTDISIRGNATTGYKWIAAENPGLIVSGPVYIPDEADGKVGTGGTYHWYVAADKPGDYVFTAYEMPPAGDEPAGSIEVPVSIAKKTADVPDIAALVSVEKTGTTYSIGDTMEVILTEYKRGTFYVKDHDDGISIDTKEILVKDGDKEVTCVKFTVTALKEGNHTFSIGVNDPILDGFDNVVYEDTMHIADTGAEPMTPRGTFSTLSKISDHPAYPGEYVDISIRGNATTGYHWVAAENPGLTVSEPVYIPDEAPEGMVGVGGTYHWYVTTDKPGKCEFTAYEMPPAGDEPTGRVIVPLVFARNPADVPEAAVSFSVEKTGTTYNIGDTMEVILNVRDVSTLYVKECDDGISVDKKAVSVKYGDKEVTCAKFTVTAMKEGNHTFSIGLYDPRLEEFGLDDVIYEDSMHVVKTGEEPMTPRGIFTQIGHAGHPAYPGDYYDISVRGNATTGYQWVAAENPGLIVSEPVYIPDEAPEGMVGAGGTYHWYVTADKPGEYQFTAYEMPPAGDEPTGRVIVPIAFAKKAE